MSEDGAASVDASQWQRFRSGRWPPVLIGDFLLALVLSVVFAAVANRAENQRFERVELLENLRYVRSVEGSGTPDDRIPLTYINLRGQPLTGLDLSQANLSRANLVGQTWLRQTSRPPA